MNDLNEKINKLYDQYRSARSSKMKKDLYKAIKKAEGKRRKQKLDKEGIFIC